MVQPINKSGHPRATLARSFVCYGQTSGAKRKPTDDAEPDELFTTRTKYEQLALVRPGPAGELPQAGCQKDHLQLQGRICQVANGNRPHMEQACTHAQPEVACQEPGETSYTILP